MNIDQQFDDHVKEQFNDYSPDVPPRIWDNIVEKKKRRVGGILLFMPDKWQLLILLCILLAGGSGAWLLNSGLFDSIDKKSIATAKMPAGSNDTDADEQVQDAALVPMQPMAVVDEGAANDDAENECTVFSKGNFIVRPGSTGIALGSNKKNTIKDEETEDASAIEEEDKEMVYTGVPVGGTLPGRLLYAAPVPKIEGQKGPVLNKRSTPSVMVPGCPGEKDIAGNKRYFEIYGSIDHGLRSLKDTGNSLYLQQRKESARSTSAYSVGIRYTKVFGSGMSVRGGLNFSQINEKFSFAKANVVNVVYIINASGDTTGSYTTTGRLYKTTHNRYRSIDVPLLIGYEMGNGRLHTNINAGPGINIYSWQRGEVMGSDGRPVSTPLAKATLHMPLRPMPV